MTALSQYLSVAQALVGGESEGSAPTATVALSVEQRYWDRYREIWLDGVGTCSGSVVALDPLTIATAAHCLRDVRLDEATHLPQVRIGFPNSSHLESLEVRAASYAPIEKVEANLADDLAILVFDGRAEVGLTALPIWLGAPPMKARLCGHGRGSWESPDALPSARCAEKAVIRDVNDFSRFVPVIYKTLDQLLYAQFRVQFESKNDLLQRTDALLAVSRLNAAGDYDIGTPMLTQGDSGGPWIMSQNEGRPALVAITSFIETFYRKNTVWPVFKVSNLPVKDYPYVGYGIRLSSPESLSRLKSASQLGAPLELIGVGGH